MLSLEQKVEKNSFDFSTLNELMPMYSNLVEFYDELQDPISFYFMEKIQNVLTLQKSLKIISIQRKSSVKNLVVPSRFNSICSDRPLQ